MDVSDVGKSGEKLDRSTFSDFLLGWVWPLVKQGYSSVLLEDQIPAMPTELSADVALRNALKYWEEEKKAAVRAGRLPSLERALWKVCRREVLIGCVAGAVAGLCNTVAKPLLLRSLIDGTSDGTPTNTLWFLFAGICFALMVESLGFIINRHAIVDRWLTLFSASFSSLVQRQSMLVATSQMTDVPDLANLVSSDLARIHGNTLSLSLAPIAVTSLASGVVILVYTIGVAGLVGMCPMFLLLGANMCMSKLAHKAEEDNLDLTDKRMGIMTQIIHGIRAIKFCAWETSFSNIVTEARRQECVPLKRFRVLNQGTVQLGRANPYVGAVFAFVFLALKSRNDPEAFRPSDIFAALNVFLSLRVPLIILPESIMYFATMRVSIRRLQRVLEVPLAECHWQKQLQDAPDNDACIVVRNATFLWPALSHAKEPCKSELSIPTPVDERMSLPAGEPLLIDDLNIPQGCFCAVVGSVASGKSSLFSALLGEMPQNKGDSSALVNIHGQSLAFVPQKPFILSGTIRENIIMGAAPPDEDKLRLAIRRAALDKDIAMLPSGEYTEVGERGVVLSGGQQQRLSIARAFYAKSDLLLADDPLSALDPAVADKVFHGLWSYVHESHGSRTCVVILNQLRLLPQFDHVIMVSRGRIVDSGAPSDLLQSGGMLADLCTSAGCLSSMATSPMYLQESIAEYNPEKQSPDRLGSKLVLSEQKLVGALSTSVIVRYIQGMGYCYFAFCVLLIVLCYSSMAFTDFWLASWVDAREKKWNLNEDVDDDFYVGVYGGVAGLFLMFLWISSYCFSSGAVRSSKHLHSECLNTVLRAPVSFFEATPSGRITSRFSNDLAGVDTTIPRWIDNNMQIFATMIVLGVQIAYAVPIMSPILLVCYMCYGFIVKAINQTNREARRYANSAMSPVLTILNESCNGRILLRTMSKVDTFRSLFCQRIDEANRFGYASGSIVTFGQMFVYTLSVLISGTTGALILVQKDSYEPSTVALALTYTFLLPYFFNMFAMIFQFLLNSLGSLERLLQYGHGGIVPEEPPWYMPTEPSQAEPWPSRGEVVFDAVSLVYRPGLPKSVDNISFTVAPSEKIGVVGRSGAGKSSLMVLLFRLHEASEGRILIDGVDISTVGLKSLRSAVAIVPQEPLLISGTVRLNLDPFGDHSDSDLAKVLEEVQLDPSLLINNTAASTLSHGERQLLTVGRTLLWPSRLRVFDEPTSNIDTATDNIIQRLIRSSERLRASTQITIAHRLQTVIDCHRIMVMAAGCLVEVGAPSDLLADPNSELSALARHTGIQSDTKGATSTVTSI